MMYIKQLLRKALYKKIYDENDLFLGILYLISIVVCKVFGPNEEGSIERTGKFRPSEAVNTGRGGYHCGADIDFCYGNRCPFHSGTHRGGDLPAEIFDYNVLVNHGSEYHGDDIDFS